MSERKVLNKYYPPDFDPARVPKLRLQRERQYTVRTMAPFNMRCKTCGDYIYQGKKFNAKTENVQDERYIGLRIFRFYIKCPKCISEISFKTDPENEDYTLEHGATRLFEAAKMFRKAAEKEKTDREEEEANNPMKVLENRTKDSKLEMEILENLEELKEINTRKVDIDYADILKRKAEAGREMLKKQEEEDEEEIRRLFGKPDGPTIKRLHDDSDEDANTDSSPVPFSLNQSTDILTSDNEPQVKKFKLPDNKGSKFNSKSALAGLVRVKNPLKSSTKPAGGVDRPQASRAEPAASSSEPVKEPAERAARAELVTLETPSMSTDLDKETESNDSEVPDTMTEHHILQSIQEGLCKKLGSSSSERPNRRLKAVGLSMLGGYADSDDSSDSATSD